MRQGRTYRAERKRKARRLGITLEQLAQQEAAARELAAKSVHAKAMAMSPEDARRALAIWAKSGGKINVLTGEGVPPESTKIYIGNSRGLAQPGQFIEVGEMQELSEEGAQ